MKKQIKYQTISPENYFSTEDGKTYFPQKTHVKHYALPPGVYNVMQSPMVGTFFVKEDYSSGELLKFDDSVITNTVEGIQTFWKKKELFKTHNFPFRRGILLYGPPGSGKTCAVKMIINNIIADGGIALIYSGAHMLKLGMDAIRKVQPDVPVVVIMEDLESILNYDDESALLNMLDGIGGFENIVYLATTNYINQLQGRIKNRPSRFDIRHFIDFPNETSRKMYLQYISKSYKKKLPLDKWAKDTQGFSIAHLKEMYLSLVFFESDYEETLKRLTEMSSDKDYDTDDSDLDLDDDLCDNPNCAACYSDNSAPSPHPMSANGVKGIN